MPVFVALAKEIPYRSDIQRWNELLPKHETVNTDVREEALLDHVTVEGCSIGDVVRECLVVARDCHVCISCFRSCIFFLASVFEREE